MFQGPVDAVCSTFVHDHLFLSSYLDDQVTNQIFRGAHLQVGNKKDVTERVRQGEVKKRIVDFGTTI